MNSFSSKFALLYLFFFILISYQIAYSQSYDSTKTYEVLKYDKSKVIGKILSDDGRELKMMTNYIGMVYVPKHLIISITEFGGDDVFSDDSFTTRYFITTNGLPIRKGESYYQFTLLGPDVQFGIANNFGVGVITSWAGTPFIVSLKYSNQMKGKWSYALGTLAGGTIWGGEGSVRAALPFATLTYGLKNSTISFSGGYGVIFVDGESDSQWMFSVAGMKDISKSSIFVFDSMIFPTSDNLYLLLIPGYRIKTSDKNAFQFGFPGLISFKESSPFAFPMISWFRKF